MKYLLEIRETLSKQVKINAESIEDALSIIQKQYLNSKIVLNADDFVGYEIIVSNDSVFEQE